jgi:starvation-inducible outer membrane lipoprotein
MKHTLTSALIVFAFLLSACGKVATPSPTAQAEEKPVETEAVVEVRPETDECVTCHTDQQRLMDTAAPVVEAEGESKGVG